MQDRTDFKHARVSNRIIEDSTLKAADKSVYMALSYYADNDTSECYPKRETLMRMAGVSDKTLSKAIRRLEDCGYIAVNGARRKNGQWRSNTYSLL